MKYFISAQTIFFCLTLTAVPTVARAQQAGDDGSGPPTPTVLQDGSVAHGSGKAYVERTTRRDKAAETETAKKDEDSTDEATPAPNDAKFSLGGMVGSSTAQSYNVGAQVGVQGNGASGNLEGLVGGSRTQDGFQGRADMTNVRITPNGYNSSKVTVTGTLDGAATLGSSGHSDAMGVAAATVLIPFNESGSCFLNLGPAVGGQLSANVASGVSSSVAGAGGYSAFACAPGRFNMGVSNSFVFDSIGNGPNVVAQQKAHVQYLLTHDVAISASAEVDEEGGHPKYITSAHLDYNFDIAGDGNKDKSASKDQAQ